MFLFGKASMDTALPATRTRIASQAMWCTHLTWKMLGQPAPKCWLSKTMMLLNVFFFFFFFFTQVQTPVTLCSGELWSILVVRLAHSADLRSRLRHVSSAPSVAYSTRCSRVVTHPGTNPARRCLTSVIWREPVCHRRSAVECVLPLMWW